MYLAYACWAVPVSFWDTGDFGFVAVGVAALVTAVAQQQEILIIPLLTYLTVLQNKALLITATFKEVIFLILFTTLKIVLCL